jgi:hypothetical protein
MIARFIGTTIKAVAHDIARFTAALGRVDKAARALLGAHESDALGAAVGAQQAPFVLGIA